MCAGKDERMRQERMRQERMRQERMRRKCTKEGGCVLFAKSCCVSCTLLRGMVGGKVYDTLRSCRFSVTRGRIIVGASST